MQTFDNNGKYFFNKYFESSLLDENWAIDLPSIQSCEIQIQILNAFLLFFKLIDWKANAEVIDFLQNFLHLLHGRNTAIMILQASNQKHVQNLEDKDGFSLATKIHKSYFFLCQQLSTCRAFLKEKLEHLRHEERDFNPNKRSNKKD